MVSIEAAIRQYVQKYAKTAKIKNIVDTFIHKLDAVGCFEETKKELASHQEESERIVQQIDNIHKKIDSVEEAKKFKDAVDDAVIKVDDEAKEVVKEIIKKFQLVIQRKIEELRGEELELDMVESELERLEHFAKRLEPDFQTELEELIRHNLIETSDELLLNYRQKLSSLTDELDGIGLSGIPIDPLKFMGGNVVSVEAFSVDRFAKTKEVEDGEEWVKNTDKKWYKPWTWFQEKGYYRTKYKDVKYIDASEMAQNFLRPVQNVIHENGENARKYALKQSNKISSIFTQEFERLDDLLKNKLNELKSYAMDKDQAEKRIKESEKRLKWLEKIRDEVESILEI